MKSKMPQLCLFGYCTDHAASWFWNRSFIIVTVIIEYCLISVGFYWLVKASEAVFAGLPTQVLFIHRSQNSLRGEIGNHTVFFKVSYPCHKGENHMS